MVEIIEVMQVLAWMSLKHYSFKAEEGVEAGRKAMDSLVLSD